MNKTAIIVAGGIGTRMESDIPKQFMLLAGCPLIMHCINAFYVYDKGIQLIIVLPENEFQSWKKLCTQYNFNLKHKLVAGGKTRFDSVKNGLSQADSSGLVAIHDGARPLIKQDLIKRSFESAEKHGNSVPVVTPTDSMRIIEQDTNRSVNRNNFKIVQTPQVFYSETIKKAFRQEYSENFTDEANVAESFGEIIRLIEGDPENIKITRPSDISYAEILLAGK